MDIPDNLLCLFSAEITEQDGSFIVEIPHRKIHLGEVEPRDIYRVALLSREPHIATESSESASQEGRNNSATPVEEGDVIDLEIEDIGEQGDGIARVGPGYVVIVPDTELNERVSVEITGVRPNMAFSEVVKRYDHTE